jgi:hypothetical protein
MNDAAQTEVERRLRLASALLLAGLGLQALTLLTNHPLAFLGFIFVASPLVLAGIVVYLWSLIAHS